MKSKPPIMPTSKLSSPAASPNPPSHRAATGLGAFADRARIITLKIMPSKPKGVALTQPNPNTRLHGTTARLMSSPSHPRISTALVCCALSMCRLIVPAFRLQRKGAGRALTQQHKVGAGAVAAKEYDVEPHQRGERFQDDAGGAPACQPPPHGGTRGDGFLAEGV